MITSEDRLSDLKEEARRDRRGDLLESIIERLCHDHEYDHETFDWFGERRGHGHKYKDWKHLMTFHDAGNAMYEYCPVVKRIIENLASSAIGEHQENSYSISRRKTPLCKTSLRIADSRIDRWACLISEYTSALSWTADSEEVIVRRNSTGEAIRCVEYEERNDELFAPFFETSEIQVPNALSDEKAKKAPYGVLYEERKGKPITRKPKTYYRGPFNRLATEKDEIEEVPAWRVQHSMNGVKSNAPRGYTPFLNVRCNSRASKSLREGIRLMVAARMADSVIHMHPAADKKKRDALRSTEMRNMAEKAKKEGRVHDGEFVYEQGRTRHYFGEGHSVTMPDLQLSGADLKIVIEIEEGQIGLVVQAPDIVTFGKSDIGNRDTTKSSMKGWYRRIRREQAVVAEMNIDLLWKLIQFYEGFDDATMMEIKKIVKIEAKFRDPELDFKSESETWRGLVGDEIASPQQARQALSIDDEKFCKDMQEICAVTGEEGDDVPPGEGEEDDPPGDNTPDPDSAVTESFDDDLQDRESDRKALIESYAA